MEKLEVNSIYCSVYSDHLIVSEFIKGDKAENKKEIIFHYNKALRLKRYYMSLDKASMISYNGKVMNCIEVLNTRFPNDNFKEFKKSNPFISLLGAQYNKNELDCLTKNCEKILKELNKFWKCNENITKKTKTTFKKFLEQEKAEIEKEINKIKKRQRKAVKKAVEKAVKKSHENYEDTNGIQKQKKLSDRERVILEIKARIDEEERKRQLKERNIKSKLTPVFKCFLNAQKNTGRLSY
jgi:hypothetical protein